jgi:membrane-associated phospholipid phosphatase
MIGTANVSNISLKLLETTTTWNDAFFWAIEEPLLVALTSEPIHLNFWETIYNSAWNAEMLALSAVLVATRCPVWGARFCVSFILLFYLGRLFGLASPVLGPALFAPEHFGYLEGSITNSMMQSVSATIEAGPNGIEKSAILLGGVAAMPSLHVGMISLASWWLARSVHIATPFVVLWLLTVWTSTVLLGWHYVLDGLGGILTAALCIWLTSLILKGLRVGEPAPAIGVPGLLRRR